MDTRVNIQNLESTKLCLPELKYNLCRSLSRLVESVISYSICAAVLHC